MDELTLNYESTIIKVVTENWRLVKLFQKVTSKLDVSEQNRYINQLRYFEKTINNCLQDVGMKIIHLEGQVYDSGMAVSPINIDEFEQEDQLIIDQVLEPLIMGNDGTIKKQGLVNLKTKDKK
jgi:hypothetical protein